MPALSLLPIDTAFLSNSFSACVHDRSEDAKLSSVFSIFSRVKVNAERIFITGFRKARKDALKYHTCTCIP